MLSLDHVSPVQFMVSALHLVRKYSVFTFQNTSPQTPWNIIANVNCLLKEGPREWIKTVSVSQEES